MIYDVDLHVDAHNLYADTQSHVFRYRVIRRAETISFYIRTAKARISHNHTLFEAIRRR